MSSPGRLTSSLEVTEVQEELVRINLKIKALTEEFPICADERDMEELNEEIRGRLAEFRRVLARLESLAAGQAGAEERDMLLGDAEGHRTQLATCQESFRRANLACILRLQGRDRSALLAAAQDSSSDDPNAARRRRKRSRDRGALVRDTGRVTDNLTAISRQLAATVERSAMTVDELAQSSQTVTETQEEFKSMGAVIGQSRKLINKYGRRETTDKVLIFFAFAFFFAVVFYILRKRVLGPLDPFSLAWNGVTTLTASVMALLGL